MQLTKEMRKSLERNLPQSTLDYLTEMFSVVEKCYQKIDKLEWQLEQKDQMLQQMYRGNQGQTGDGTQNFRGRFIGNRENNSQPWQVGFEYPGHEISPESFYGRRGRYPSRGDYDVKDRRGVDRKYYGPGNHGYWENPDEKTRRRYMPSEEPGVMPLYNEGGSGSGQGGDSGGSDGGGQ